MYTFLIAEEGIHLRVCVRRYVGKKDFLSFLGLVEMKVYFLETLIW